jgi:hypothetical protein
MNFVRKEGLLYWRKEAKDSCVLRQLHVFSHCRKGGAAEKQKPFGSFLQKRRSFFNAAQKAPV